MECEYLLLVVFVVGAVQFLLGGLFLLLDARQLALRFVQLRLQVIVVVSVLLAFALQLQCQ